MCRVNSSLGGLVVVSGYIRYNTFNINKKEPKKKIKINKNIKVGLYEKNIKINNCEMF
jgi:hypothetical protein